MDSTSATYWAWAAMAGIALVYKARDLVRAPRRPDNWLVCSTIFFIMMAFLLAAPAAVAAINRLSGVANLAAPLVYGALVCEGASALALVTYWREESGRAWPKARRWLLGYGAVLATMIALFLLGDAPVERRVDFDTYYARTPPIAAFVVLYLVAHAVAGIGVALHCWRWSRVAGRPWLRRGLLAIVLGLVLGRGFDVCKLIAVAARWAGTDLDVLSSVVAPGLAGLGAVVIAVGFVLPVAGERLTRLSGWLGRLRAYRTLYPLWDALRRATPLIVPPVRLPWWDLELRLTRRLTEIGDGRLALRPYVDPRVGEVALRLGRESGLTGDDLLAVVDAARIRAAVEAKARHIRFPPDPGATAGAGRTGGGGDDGASELAWLSRVATAFERSPVVAETLAQAATADPGVGIRE